MKQKVGVSLLVALALAMRLLAITPAERARGVWGDLEDATISLMSQEEALKAAKSLESQWQKDAALHMAVIEARLGDLYLAAEDFRQAASFYSEAARHGSTVESHRGALQGGSLYFHEIYRSERYSSLPR